MSGVAGGVCLVRELFALAGPVCDVLNLLLMYSVPVWVPACMCVHIMCVCVWMRLF